MARGRPRRCGRVDQRYSPFPSTPWPRGMRMPIRAKTLRAAIVCLSALLPGSVDAEGIDTEHLFGFMIGTDIGTVGEREFQSETTGRFGKSGGSYRAIGQQLELE